MPRRPTARTSWKPAPWRSRVSTASSPKNAPRRSNTANSAPCSPKRTSKPPASFWKICPHGRTDDRLLSSVYILPVPTKTDHAMRWSVPPCSSCPWVRVQPAQFLAQGFHAPGVDHLVRLAEVIQLLELSVRPVPELGTSPVTDRLVLADLALGVGDGLFRGEGVAPRATRDFAPRIQIHIAQFPALHHEEIAGVDVLVGLYHHVAVAGFVDVVVLLVRGRRVNHGRLP